MIKIKKCLNSFQFAFRGIYLFFRNENNARVHLLATILVILLGLYVHLSRFEWLWVSLSITLVWIAEAFNTALEKLTDLVSPEFNPKAGLIKDLSAAAVLFTAIFAFITGMVIFIPKFF